MLWSTLELGHHTTRRNMDNYIDSRIERAHSYPLSLILAILGIPAAATRKYNDDVF